MSRSFKRNPYWSVYAGGNRAGSNKHYKRHCHRSLRRAVRVALHTDNEIPHDKLFGNPWWGPVDMKLPCWRPVGYRK